jgi:hypothetical protein
MGINGYFHKAKSLIFAPCSFIQYCHSLKKRIIAITYYGYLWVFFTRFSVLNYQNHNFRQSPKSKSPYKLVSNPHGYLWGGQKLPASGFKLSHSWVKVGIFLF